MSSLIVCKDCGSEITDKDVLGCNRKMLGKKTKNYYCLKCMAKEYEVKPDFLLEKIQEWKEQGCVLFE